MKKVIRKILILVCICVIGYAGYNIADILLKYKKIDDVYNEIVDDYVEQDDEMEYLDVDFDALQKRCKDIVGWIDIPETRISYPVVQSHDNDDYLHCDIDGNYLYSGTLFVDKNCKKAFDSDNTVIYGHNMKNGSMFKDLHKFINDDQVKASPYMYIYLPDGTINQYALISAHTIDGEGIAYSSVISSVDKFDKMLQQANKIDAAYEVKDDSRFVTLSTCTNAGSEQNDRVVVHGILVKNIRK